jgi:DNA replication protein DnaC
LNAHEPSLKRAADACAEFIAAMDRGAEPYWLTLLGRFGCGKTMLARQTFDAASQINPGNPMINPIWPPNWSNQTRRTYDAERPSCFYFDEKDFAQRMRGGEFQLPESVRGDFLVVLDELGFARDPTNFVAEAIARLAQSRIRGWMIWCSNLSLNNIAERIDGRVMSRLIRDENRVVQITAPDYALRPDALKMAS